VRRTAFASAFASLVLLSCGEPQKQADQSAALGGDIAARVGTEVIPVSLVGKVAAEQKIPPREALRHIVDDAIAANAARARGLDKEPPASWRMTAARGRFTTERLLQEARAKGRPTDDEVNELSKIHWREVDRPVSVRVQHALVMRPKGGDVAPAKALAALLHDAVAAAPTGPEFERVAKAVPHGNDLEIRVEELPAIADDGYVVTGTGMMNEVFAKAAHALANVGDTSGVVETTFGWHVIRLVERLPEQRMPFETRRTAFQEEVFAMRSRAALQARVSAMKISVEVLPSAEQLMRAVRSSSFSRIRRCAAVIFMSNGVPSPA
jgi:PPIC-type PPIASE domain